MTEEWSVRLQPTFSFLHSLERVKKQQNSDRPDFWLVGAVQVCPEQDGCLLWHQKHQNLYEQNPLVWAESRNN